MIVAALEWKLCEVKLLYFVNGVWWLWKECLSI